MEIFDGRYSWSGKKEDHREPIAWFPGAYDLKIIDLRVKNSGITHIKPFLCVYKSTGEGHSISSNPEKFAKRICGDFSLDIEKVLWVEEDKEEPGSFEVVVFIKWGSLIDESFFQAKKRLPTQGELAVIIRELSHV